MFDDGKKRISDLLKLTKKLDTQQQINNKKCDQLKKERKKEGKKQTDRHTDEQRQKLKQAKKHVNRENLH